MDDTETKRMTGEEIVISGISGVFPKSDNVFDFMNNLYDGVDMVSDEPRWTIRDPEIPKHMGKVSGIEKFDAQFFKVGYQQALVLDPLSRKILEHAYGAIFDSGNTHATLNGKVIGVFIGASFADFTSKIFYDIEKRSDFIVGGSSKSMLANRISYWVDGRGPSYNLDFSCASSIAALEQAYKSLRAGDCDAAVVGGANICMLPTLSLNLKRYGLLSMDGKTKCFDKDANGYVRGEAASVIFLQKAKDAKRIYAEIYHAKGTYKMKADSLFLPVRQSEELQEFFKDVYSEIDIDPNIIEYIEANGAALPEADINEIDAMSKVFTNNEFKLGCVKSNMGNAESVSGLCGLTKLCLAYYKGHIPANLHCNNPQDVLALKDRSVQVVTDNTNFNKQFTALNNFSLTGANFHVILKGHFKEKKLQQYNCKIPRLVVASGRQESCVTKIFNELKMKPIDFEEIALLHDIFSQDIVGHTGRGYTVLDTKKQGETVSVSEGIDYYPGLKRPLWFVYSGMGSQWAGMGADLMKIPTFAKAIEGCHKVLEPKGIDLVKIVTETDNKIFDNILNAFVGIGAVQIGLTDILKDMGIIPDYIIGHSLGEMACAYHDDTFTAEELILSTYSRGKAILDSELTPGLMAAVGVGYKILEKQCPPDIDIGCHNSFESSTISGPTDSMKIFISKLKDQGIFAKEVPSANVAYHSRYVADAGPELLRRLKQIIKNPKLRSQKWISTSVPQENWDSDTAKYSSAEYHTNNLLKPVLFEEMTSKIPDNAVVVEIAPHGLLQAILKRSHKECTHIPLTKRGETNGVKFLLEAIGKLYSVGFNPKVSALYPKVEYPVSTETPLLSHLVEWEHSEHWPILETDKVEKFTSTSRNLVISVHDKDYQYIQDYSINGVNVLPEAALLVYVWETIAMYRGKYLGDLSVIFRDIKFHSDVIIEAEKPTRISVMITKGSNNFEISQEDVLKVSGVITIDKVVKFHHNIKEEEEIEDFDDIKLNSNDIYKIFDTFGYSYSGKFKCIQSTNLDRNKGLVKWSNDWISFIDGLIQLNMLSKACNGTPRVKFIRKLSISTLKQENSKPSFINGVDCHNAQVFNIYDVTRCAGIEIDNITFVEELPVEKDPDVFVSKSFYPYNNTGAINLQTAIEINLQIVTENSNSKDINVLTSVSCIGTLIHKIVEITPSIGFNIKNIRSESGEFVNCVYKNQDDNVTNVVMIENVLQDKVRMKILQSLISKDSYVITIEDQIPKIQNSIKDYFSIISSMSDGSKIIVLLKKLTKRPIEDVIYIPMTMENKFLWIPKVYGEIQTAKQVVLISERQAYSGILGLVKKLKLDGYNNISVFVIDDFHAPKFDIENVLFREQLEKNLTCNVLKRGQWGGYYYTSCKKSSNIRNWFLKNAVPGDLDTVSWVEASKITADKNIVQVCFSSLSVKDYEKATSTFKDGNEGFGMDFSGIDKNGDKVMGIISGGSIANIVEADSDLIWPVPDHWTLEEAATVPLPYINAYYCLTRRTVLNKNFKVFVTGGAGAFGQAVITLCLAMNCVVFTTVGDERKKKALLRVYSQLDENNICSSNDDSFYQMIMLKTKKQGCNLVINSTTGYLREVVQKCVGFMGVFLDLSKHEFEENKIIGMEYINLDRTIKAVDLKNIFRPENKADKIVRNFL